MKAILAIGAALLALGCGVRAQDYPTKPIRMVVPYPPGGTPDLLGRMIAQRLNEVWGQPVIVENRSGAGGNIGADFVAKAVPDGYTLLVTNSPTMVISASLYPKLPYDPLKDLAPITQGVLQPNILVVHPSVPARSVIELIRLAKANPGKLNFASPGIGTVGHLAGEMFKMMAKADILHVPYRGAGPALTDVLGGQVTIYFGAVAPVLPMVKAGKLRLLAVGSTQRSALLPGIPTVSEAGLAGFDASASAGLFAPRATAKAIVAKLNAEVVKFLGLPEIKRRLADLGAEASPGTPEEFAAYMRAEMAKWAAVIKQAGVRAE